MDRDEKFKATVAAIVAADLRFAPAAYEFVSQAVTYTSRKHRRENADPQRRHITGQQLLDGFRDLAKEQFGPLAENVIRDWGITRTEDVGDIVFRLVNAKLLGASENDSPADFADGYSFSDAFVRPFLPDPDAPAPVLPVIA
jgi:uncharacterized repeat protein (TIGR04138 family)